MNTAVAWITFAAAVGSIGILVVLVRTVMRVLDYIVAQFKTDSGTSLRDAVNRLEASSERLEQAADVIAANLVVSKGLVEGVADELVVAKIAIAGVASDLEHAHKRADATNGPHGAAADAAVQTDPEELP